jgi:hypothetical protein
LTSRSAKFGKLPPGFFARIHSPGFLAMFDGSGSQYLPFAKLGKRRRKMLETIAIILVVLWLLGFVTSYTMGGFIHILLVVAVVVILIRVIQGRRL